MRSRRPTQEHTDAVARRLAELSAQLAATREVTAFEHVEHVEDSADSAARKVVGDRAVGGDWWSDHTRIAQRTPLSIVPAVPDDLPEAPAPMWSATLDDHAEPSRLPVPGRHASRRSRVVAGAGLSTLPGRLRLGTAQLAAVAVLVAVGLAITCWWVVRGDPEPATPVTMQRADTAPGPALVVPTGGGGEPGGSAAPAPASSPASSPAAPASGTGRVTVDVAGKVRRPGIVVLDDGARVVDAVEQAGGARPGVDLTSLNLARVLVDGEQLLVGLDTARASAAVPVPPTSGAPTPTTLVDLNLADQTQLETIPQIGPVTASAIIAWRAEHGGFTAVTELLEVDGIGDATLAQVSPYVTV